MLHFWLYVGCCQSARDTPISALEGASPFRKQCCRQVLLHSILPLTAGGGQQLTHHPWTRTVQSNVVHDHFLPWHYPSTYMTELRKDCTAHIHIKATAATVWLNVLLTRVHTAWYIAAA
jgi:hypothetical protein